MKLESIIERITHLRDNVATINWKSGMPLNVDELIDLADAVAQSVNPEEEAQLLKEHIKRSNPDWPDDTIQRSADLMARFGFGNHMVATEIDLQITKENQDRWLKTIYQSDG